MVAPKAEGDYIAILDIAQREELIRLIKQHGPNSTQVIDFIVAIAIEQAEIAEAMEERKYVRIH